MTYANKQKTYICEGEIAPPSQIGASLDALAATIEARRQCGGNASYTRDLLEGPLERVLKKVCEEATEVALAAKEVEMLDAYASGDDLVDTAINHLRYEAGDVVYHMAVLLARFGIGADELAAEVNTRMTEEERPRGGVRLHERFVCRGK